MRRQVLAIALVIALFAWGTVVPVQAQPSRPVGNLPVQVTGTASWAGTSGTFQGTYNIQRFIAENNKLYAVGTLTGTASGKQVTVVGVKAPVTATTLQQAASLAGAPDGYQPVQASCPILHLAIGAIHLDLLGLVVDLAPVDLNIVAQPGPGNLLGNLLCAIAGLLDPGPPLGGLLNQLVALLNQILAALGGIGVA
jgi:hypothetical protein